MDDDDNVDVEEEEEEEENDDDDEEEEDDAEEESRSQDGEAYFVRACAAEIHMDVSQELFCVENYRESAVG